MEARQVKKENVNIDQIVAEFAAPLDKFDAIEVESNGEAAQQLEKIVENLSKTASWKTKHDAINFTVRLIKGGIQYYPGGDLQGLAPLIAAALLDLRAIIVRSATILVASAAQSLEDDFTQSATIVFPSLLKQLSSKNAVISNYCHCALLEIAKHCPTKPIGRLFLSNYSSKNTFNRQIAAESCHIICETWPYKIISAISKDISTVITKLNHDQDETIRTIVGEAVLITKDNDSKKKRPPSSLQYSPTSSEKRCSPSQSPRSVRFSIADSPRKNEASSNAQSIINTEPNSPKNFEPVSPIVRPENNPSNSDAGDDQSSKSINSKTELTIIDYMPPASKKEAIIFKSYLDGIVRSNDFSVISDEKLLVSSVLCSSTLISKPGLWKNELPILIKQFPDAFFSQIVGLMANFGFCEWIYELAVNQYTAQLLGEVFVTGRRQKMSDAYGFFVIHYKLNAHVIILNENMKNLLQSLIQTNPRNDDTCLLKDALDRAGATPTIEAVLNTVIMKLANCEKWDNDLDLLTRMIETGECLVAQIESKYNVEVPKLISRGTDIQRQNTILFIIDNIAKIKKISFASSVDTIIAVLLDGNYSWKSTAIDCLAKMMGDIKSLAVAITLTEQGKHCEFIIVEAFLIYFTDAPPQRLLPVQKIIVSKLLPFISSQDLDMRKSVTLIFAEFKRKLPKEFGKLLNKKFTPTQKRLIEMSAMKACTVRK